MREVIVKIKPLTPIWTGNAYKKNTTLRETSIIGSLRWWYEALIRGLGGSACDPTSNNGCKLSGREKTDGERRKNMCPACYLFGCTGWARKFRLEIEKLNNEILLKFIELRKIEDDEWALLNLILYIIAKYGAIGGKTVLKPSDEQKRQNKPYHKDFGLIKIIDSNLKMFQKKQLQAYVKNEHWRKPVQDGYEWVSIENFWCVNGKYLSRKSYMESSFNKILGRGQSKNDARWLINGNDPISEWLAGSQNECKKVFSFKELPRTFGFINQDIMTFDEMKKRLKDVWGNENNWKFLKGNEILDILFHNLRRGEDDK